MNNNTNNNEYRIMRELFAAEATIPESTEKRIKSVCEALEDKPQKKMTGIFGGAFNISRRAAAAAAAALVLVIGAGTALAAGAAHGKLFQTTMGPGVADNSEDRVYYDGFGEPHEFPLFERADVDEAAAEAALGRYIVSVDAQAERHGTTFDFKDFVIDENGIGYLSYTLENPDGLKDIIGRYESGSEVYIDTEKSGVPQPYIACGGAGSSPDSRTVINDSLSTDTSAYIVELFALPCPLGDAGELSVRCGTGRISIPEYQPVPVREMTSSDGQHKIRLSPVGMTAECPAEGVYECITKELYVGDYTVISDEKNINNTFFSLCWGVDRVEGEEPVPYTVTSYVFNRLVLPDTVGAVTLTAKHTEPVAPAAPAEVYSFDGTKLSTEKEDPFHFAFENGTTAIEVYVLTRDTLSGCSDEELKRFVAFEHGAASYEELIADGRFDERLASREYMLESHKLSVDSKTMVSADLAIYEYLTVLNDHYPEQLGQLRYLVVELCECGDISENGMSCAWRFTRSNIDALHDSVLDAETRKFVLPCIEGYNGYIDGAANEWVYYDRQTVYE